MNRSQFLALIPAISAIPLIGKDIIQKPDKIEIYQPEQLKAIQKTPYFQGFDLSRCQFQLVQDGEVLASGWVKEITVSQPEIDVSVRDSYGYKETIAGMTTAEVHGIITNFYAVT